MRKMTIEVMDRKIREGKLEMHSNIFGSTTKYAEVRTGRNRAVETIEVLYTKPTQEP